MLLLTIIKKNRSLILPRKTITHCHFLHFTTAASKPQNPSPKPTLIVEYLINSCGFSSQKADSASKLISNITSVDQAHSVRHFFKHQGFSDNCIRKLISNCPRILSTDVNETIKPMFCTLREMGFSESEIQLLLASNPSVLFNPLGIRRLEFWQNFLITNNKKDLVSVFCRNRNLICMDIDSGIVPKICLLKKHGLPEANIIRILKRDSRLIMRSSESIQALLKSTKELVCDPKSSMFGQVLSSLNNMARETLGAKMKFFKGFGWSEQEVLDAIRKAPSFILLSEENIMAKMEFLVRRAGFEQSYIASHPCLLTLSLEKRLKPRYYVTEILKANGAVINRSFYGIMCLTEKRFVESIILPCAGQLPKIHEIYKAACAGQIPI